MAHYFDSGFSVREPAWHGLATVLDDYPGDWSEARRLAGLDWEPVAEPIYSLSGIDDEGREVYTSLDGWQRTARSDTGTTLGVTTQWYQLISHAEMGEVVEAVLEQPGVKYETAGATHGGSRVWALAYLDEPITLPGDNTATLPYLALTNRHDGTGALRLQSTSVRVVCWNTFSAAEAESDRAGTAFAFSHTKNWREHIEEARAAVKGARDEFARYREVAEHLLGIRVTPKQREMFVREFIPMPEADVVSDRVSKNIEQARQAVRTILDGPTTEHISHTAFGLVSAAGEYLDHYRKCQSRETYFSRQLLNPEKFKGRAVKLAREVAAA